MIITIRGRQGTGKTAVAEALRDYFSYRGTACIIYDYLQPIREMCEAIKIVSSSWNIKIDENDPVLLGKLYEKFEQACFRASEKRLAELTARWEELKLHYVAIIDSMPGSTRDLEDIRSFAVKLTCCESARLSRIPYCAERTESHPLEVGLNDCAVSDIFDLVVDTSETSPKEVADLIGDKIHDKMKSIFN